MTNRSTYPSHGRQLSRAFANSRDGRIFPLPAPSRDESFGIVEIVEFPGRDEQERGRANIVAVARAWIE